MPAFHPAWLDPIASISGFRNWLGRIIWIVSGAHALCLPDAAKKKKGAMRIGQTR
jgi:hypothetical protein